MRSGKLRHRVTIQTPTNVKTNGMVTVSWATFATVWASIEAMKPFDRANAQAVYPGADVTIGMHYLPGIKATMRVVDENGVIYSILGQPNDIDGRHREMVLTCQTGVAAV